MALDWAASAIFAKSAAERLTLTTPDVTGIRLPVQAGLDPVLLVTIYG